MHSKRRINIALVELLAENEIADPYNSAEDEVLSRHREVLDAIESGDESGARAASYRLLERVTSLMEEQSDS